MVREMFYRLIGINPLGQIGKKLNSRGLSLRFYVSDGFMINFCYFLIGVVQVERVMNVIIAG